MQEAFSQKGHLLKEAEPATMDILDQELKELTNQKTGKQIPEKEDKAKVQFELSVKEMKIDKESKWRAKGNEVLFEKQKR